MINCIIEIVSTREFLYPSFNIFTSLRWQTLAETRTQSIQLYGAGCFFIGGDSLYELMIKAYSEQADILSQRLAEVRRSKIRDDFTASRIALLEREIRDLQEIVSLLKWREESE